MATRNNERRVGLAALTYISQPRVVARVIEAAAHAVP
jgi:hypothetical protein